MLYYSIVCTVVIVFLLYLQLISFFLRKAIYYREKQLREINRLKRQYNLERSFEYCKYSSLSIGDYLVFKEKADHYDNLVNILTLGIYKNV